MTLYIPSPTTCFCCRGQHARVVKEDKGESSGRTKSALVEGQMLETENCRERGLGTYMNKAVVLACVR